MLRRWRTAAFGALTVLAAISCKQLLGLSEPELEPADAGTVDARKGDAQPSDAEVVDAYSAECSANLHTNPQHCGRCNHDCRGSTCETGRCVPIVVAELADGTGIFAVHKGDVYATDGDRLLKIEPDGKRTTLATGIGATPLEMYVDASYVLWSSEGDGVLACPIVGCSGPPLRVSSGHRTGAVTGLPGLTSKWQYVWVDYELSGVAMALPDAGSQRLVTFLGVDEARCANFGLTGSTAYVTDRVGGRIASITSAPKANTAGASPNACSIAARGEHVYWSDDGNVFDSAIKADGTLEPPVQLANGQSSVRSLAADESDLYWTSADFVQGGVHRCKQSGCNLEPEIVVSGLTQIRVLRVDESWLYFGSYLNQTAGAVIWKVAK